MDEQHTSMRGPGARPRQNERLRDAADSAGADDPHTAVDADVSQIRSEIAQTRADISETVDAIQDRLKPGNVVARAVGSVRDATARKVRQMTTREDDGVPRRASDWYRGNGVLQRVQDNPIPAAIAAGSLAWLAFARQSSRDYAGPPPYRSWPDADARYRRGGFDRDADLDDDDAELRDQYVETRMQSAANTVAETGQRIRERGEAAQRRVQRLARENMLTAGIVAAAAGLAIGLALPETHRENEMLGDARDAMFDRAKAVARDAVEHVQRTADNVTRAASSAMQTLDDGGSTEPGTRKG